MLLLSSSDTDRHFLSTNGVFVCVDEDDVSTPKLPDGDRVRMAKNAN